MPVNILHSGPVGGSHHGQPGVLCPRPRKACVSNREGPLAGHPGLVCRANSAPGLPPRGTFPVSFSCVRPGLWNGFC